jgi:hypothetical protein
MGARGPPDAAAADEFARLALDYTVMSKRKLLELVNAGDVADGTTRACPRSPGCAAAA